MTSALGPRLLFRTTQSTNQHTLMQHATTPLHSATIAYFLTFRDQENPQCRRINYGHSTVTLQLWKHRFSPIRQPPLFSTCFTSGLAHRLAQVSIHNHYKELLRYPGATSAFFYISDTGIITQRYHVYPNQKSANRDAMARSVLLMPLIYVAVT